MLKVSRKTELCEDQKKDRPFEKKCPSHRLKLAIETVSAKELCHDYLIG